MSQVSVYIEGNQDLGKVFGNTMRVKTEVFSVPSTVSGLATALTRSNGAVLIVANGVTTTLTPAQISTALEKLSTYTTPVVAYVGGKSVYLNALAIDLLKQSVTQEPVNVPTNLGDDVPGGKTFIPSPPASGFQRTLYIGARELDTLDPESYLTELVASNAIQKVDVGILFIAATTPTASTAASTAPMASMASTAAVPAPAQVVDYSAWMVSSPVSDDFQGSPDAVGGETIAYYNPASDGMSMPFEDVVVVEASAAVPAAAAAPSTTTVVCGSGDQPQSMTASWWLWLIIVIIIIILLIVSVVVYYRR